MVKITLDVKNCRECPHSSNNAQEHDDPFTSSPANLYWTSFGKSTTDTLGMLYENKKEE